MDSSREEMRRKAQGGVDVIIWALEEANSPARIASIKELLGHMLDLAYTMGSRNGIKSLRTALKVTQ